MILRGSPGSGHESPKYRLLIDSLLEEVSAGKFKPGGRFPSEADLVKRFGVSRITAGRAVRELARSGVVQRRAGSGTFVRANRPATAGESEFFGLIIPDFGEAEVFDPICHGMAAAPEATRHPLLWGHAEWDGADKQEQALELCRDYIRRKASGVFFAPLESATASEEVNRKILDEFERARIPVVLLDRDSLAFPNRSRHDLVGIDNHRAGYLITQHLLGLGRRQIIFLARKQPAATINARIAGFREACRAGGVTVTEASVQHLEDRPGIKRLLETQKVDACVCATDRIAGELMHELMALGYRIPEDIGLAGIDDNEYARLLPVPLTTIHQPGREIGEAAMTAMVSRIARPQMLPRDILVECRLVVRKSCGARAAYP